MGRWAGTNAAPGQIRAARWKKTTPRVDLGKLASLDDIADGLGVEELVADGAEGDAVDTALPPTEGGEEEDGGRGSLVPPCT